MYNDHKLVLGFAPTRRRMYEPKYAFENKSLITKCIKTLCNQEVEIVDIDWLNEEGLLINVEDVQKVAHHFANKKVDALFMPHCNYGTEEVVGMLGKRVGKPFLLYAPRDPMPPSEGNRMRQTDAQCGSFPSSKALQRYGVPFTYIENCPVESDTFANGFDKFLRAALVVKKTIGMRVGVMNLRPKPFLCVMFNEAELLEKFGIEIVPINAVDIIARVNTLIEKHAGDVAQVIQEIAGNMSVNKTKPKDIQKLAALRLAMLESAQLYDLEAIGSECWTVFPQSLGIAPCAAFGDITNCGLPMGCETDVMCAITMAMLTAASRGEMKPFCADLTMRHPTNNNAELLWHCGPFPVSTAKFDAKPEVVDCKGWWELEHGDMTIARLDGMNGQYSLLAGEGKAVAGPETNGTYSWFEVQNWPVFERQVIYGPYIHHVAGMHGHWGDVFEEASRYLDVKLDRPS